MGPAPQAVQTDVNTQDNISDLHDLTDAQGVGQESGNFAPE